MYWAERISLGRGALSRGGMLSGWAWPVIVFEFSRQTIQLEILLLDWLTLIIIFIGPNLFIQLPSLYPHLQTTAQVNMMSLRAMREEWRTERSIFYEVELMSNDENPPGGICNGITALLPMTLTRRNQEECVQGWIYCLGFLKYAKFCLEICWNVLKKSQNSGFILDPLYALYSPLEFTVLYYSSLSIFKMRWKFNV